MFIKHTDCSIWGCVCEFLRLCLNLKVPMCAWASLLRLPAPVGRLRTNRSAAQLSHLFRHSACSVLHVGVRFKLCRRHPTLRCGPPEGGGGDRARLRNGSWHRGHRGHGAKGPWRSRRDGENTGRVTEDNQRIGPLLGVCVRVSHALLLRLSVFLSPPDLAVASPTRASFVLFFLSAARSAALLASGHAVRSPLSLCDGGEARGVKGAMERWRSSARGNTYSVPSITTFCLTCPSLWLVVYWLSTFRNISCKMGQFTQITKKQQAIFSFTFSEHLSFEKLACEISTFVEVNGWLSLTVINGLQLLVRKTQLWGRRGGEGVWFSSGKAVLQWNPNKVHKLLHFPIVHQDHNL